LRASGFLPKDASAFKLLKCIKHLYLSGSACACILVFHCYPLHFVSIKASVSQNASSFFCLLKRYQNGNAEVR
jgi:hypothetical protein